MLLENKVGLVTGAGAGIGRATAMMYAAEGAKVGVADVRLSGAQKTVDLIRELGGEAIAIEADVSQEAAVSAMVKAVVDTFGRLDCACNNAALGGGFKPVEAVASEDWEQCQAVSLRGVWLCMKYEILAMRERGVGTIVNIASLSGVRGEALQAPYSAAKGGVIALTRTAAAENGQQGIRVNAVNPGGILTRALEHYFASVPGAREHTEGTHAMRRCGRPEEIADAVCYLSSDRASFITGHALNVDGGIMVNPHTI